MRWEKVAGALQKPKGTWLNSKSWPLLVQKAVFSLSRSWIGTCQYPLLRSRVENQRAPCRASRRSSMRGMGCASFIVATLSCLKSTQNRRLPSFFLTIVTGEAQGLLEGWMTPFVNICWTWTISSRRTAGFSRRYGWRRGGPSVSMACCSSWVQPSSPSPWLIISLNSWKRSFSCCCWMGDRCSGTGGGRSGLEVAGGGGESAMATTSRVPTFWPVCKRRGSGR